MKKSLSKLQRELIITFDLCNRRGGLTWNLRGLDLRSHNECQSVNSDYIDELNNFLVNEGINVGGKKNKRWIDR